MDVTFQSLGAAATGDNLPYMPALSLASSTGFPHWTSSCSGGALAALNPSFKGSLHHSRNEQDGHWVLGRTIPDPKPSLQLKRHVCIDLSYLDPRIVRRVRPFARGVPHVHSDDQQPPQPPSPPPPRPRRLWGQGLDRRRDRRSRRHRPPPGTRIGDAPSDRVRGRPSWLGQADGSQGAARARQTLRIRRTHLGSSLGLGVPGRRSCWRCGADARGGGHW